MGNHQVKEYDDFVPRVELLAIVDDLQNRLYTVTAWLEDALDVLEDYSELLPSASDETRDYPNPAAQMLGHIRREIRMAPFPVHSNRKRNDGTY